MNSKTCIFSIISLIFFVLFSCSTMQKSIEMHFIKIIIGSGGGASGLQNGYTIDSTGNLYSWKGRIMEENLKHIGSISKDTLSNIWELIQTNKLMELEYQFPHNNSIFIKIESINKKNYIVWNPDEKNDTTKLTNEVFNEIKSIINNVK